MFSVFLSVLWMKTEVLQAKKKQNKTKPKKKTLER